MEGEHLACRHLVCHCCVHVCHPQWRPEKVLWSRSRELLFKRESWLHDSMSGFSVYVGDFCLGSFRSARPLVQSPILQSPRCFSCPGPATCFAACLCWAIYVQSGVSVKSNFFWCFFFLETFHDTWPLTSCAGRFGPSGRKKSTKAIKMTKATNMTLKLNARTAPTETFWVTGWAENMTGLRCDVQKLTEKCVQCIGLSNLSYCAFLFIGCHKSVEIQAISWFSCFSKYSIIFVIWHKGCFFLINNSTCLHLCDVCVSC